MENWTLAEEDPLAYIDFNFNDTVELDDEYDYEMPIFAMIYEYVFGIAHFIVIICLIGACIFYFYILVKFKALRTRPNILILNYFITTLIASCLTPIFDIMRLVVDTFRFWIFEFYCLEYTLQDCGYLLTYIFALCLLLNFFLNTHHANWVEAHKNLDKYSILAIYIVGSLTLILAIVTSCFHVVIHLNHHMFPYLFTLIAIIAAILNIVHYFKSNKCFLTDSNCNQGGRPYEIIVADLIILSWLPFPLIHFFSGLLGDSFYSYFIVSLFFNILEIVVKGLPILILYLLGRYNKYFKMSYDLTLKKSLRGYRGQTTDDGDVDQILSENDFDEFLNNKSTESASNPAPVDNIQVY